ncbi:hypothetical protein PROFUN_16068, partial [Planoprotostelium fungivorum]
MSSDDLVERLPVRGRGLWKLKQDRITSVVKRGSQMRNPKTKIFEKQPNQPRHPGRKDLETRDERFEQEIYLQYSRLASISRKSRTRITNYLFRFKFCR